MSDVNDLEKPMGNAELRLRLQNIEEVGNQTHAQATKTNGQVKWQTKMIYLAMGALAILAPVSGWLCTSLISDEKQIATLKASTNTGALTAIVESAVSQAITGYNK